MLYNVLIKAKHIKAFTRLYDYFKPDYVFHAAAYKHVPLMEDNPSEAIYTNFLGTKKFF